MLTRQLQKIIVNQCFKGKVILLFGPRQVGKTTLLRSILAQSSSPSIIINADESDYNKLLTEAGTSTELLNVIGKENKIVVIDEAQQIPNIGKKLKLIFDTYPDIQLIATGSSAFELQNEANEPLTGRKKEYFMYPFTYGEMVNHTSAIEEKRMLDDRLVFGYYPDVVNNFEQKRDVLTELVNSYLYKDVLKVDSIRKPTLIQKLLQALALQVGSEVSYNELSKLVGNVDVATIEKYLDIMEKAFIIFKLSSFTRNFRNEIKKGKKYYFYDNGVRNVLISNFNPISLRSDKGALWENFLISERKKYNDYRNLYCNTYFWRTKDQAEIDYIEEYDGILHAFEFKWNPSNVRFPSSFTSTYPDHTIKQITRENFEQFILMEQ